MAPRPPGTDNLRGQFAEIRQMLDAMQNEQKKGMQEVLSRLTELEGQVREVRDAMYIDPETGKPSLRPPQREKT